MRVRKIAFSLNLKANRKVFICLKQEIDVSHQTELALL